MAAEQEEELIESAVIDAADILGFSMLKDEQKYCICEFVKGRDVFAILPTGFGKTVCFTVLPTAIDIYEKRKDEEKAINIIVSPLTALIIDQVADLLRRGVTAGYIDGDSTKEVKENVVKGLYSILFMSPEQLVDRWRKLFVSPAYKSRLVGVIIDEAHCIVCFYTLAKYLYHV